MHFSAYLLAFFFYFVGIKRKRISYDIKTSSLVSNKINQISGLEMKYHSKDIKNLYYSIIKIKNIGNSIIEKQDFSSTNPISFYTNGEFLIDASKKNFVTTRIKQSVITYMGISINDAEKCDIIVLDFEYISKKQELCFSLFHTGTIKFNCIIKDGKIINEAKITSRRKTISNVIDRLSFILYIILSFIAGFISHDMISYLFP